MILETEVPKHLIYEFVRCHLDGLVSELFAEVSNEVLFSWLVGGRLWLMLSRLGCGSRLLARLAG